MNTEQCPRNFFIKEVLKMNKWDRLKISLEEELEFWDKRYTENFKSSIYERVVESKIYLLKHILQEMGELEEKEVEYMKENKIIAFIPLKDGGRGHPILFSDYNEDDVE